MNFFNLAVNVGDYGIFEDVVVSPQIHRNLVNKIEGTRIGLSTKLKDTGIKIWYQGEFNEKQNDSHTIMVGVSF